MSDAIFRVPPPVNEPVRAYEPGSPHRESLKARLKAMAAERIEIPCVIGGKEVRTGNKRQVVMPHSHREVLADFHLAGVTDFEARRSEPLDGTPLRGSVGQHHLPVDFRSYALATG